MTPSCRRTARGFTLVEVTLSIVIGIILIAGATLLYNQAKIGAGNTRARAKAESLQGLVEEMAADSGGTYPLAAPVYTAWVQRRPDDYNMSPWGGPAAQGSGSGPTVDQQGFRAYDNVTPSAGNGPGSGAPPGDIEYKDFVGSATGSIYDYSIGQYVVYRHYLVQVDYTDGSWGWFIQSTH